MQFKKKNQQYKKKECGGKALVTTYKNVNMYAHVLLDIVCKWDSDC